MALIKTDPLITSISGKMAGNVFKRDASGQHVVSMPRILHKPSTPLQKKQRAWYSGHKKHERKDPDPLEPDDPPNDPDTFKIYALRIITTFRDPSIFKPAGFAPPDNPEEKEYAASIMTPYWLDNKPALEAVGFSLYSISMICYRYFYICQWTWGVVPAEAWSTAIEYTIIFCNKVIFLGKLLPIAGYVSILLAAWIYQIGVFFAGHWGHLTFTKWQLVVRGMFSLNWGGLYAHRTDKMYDVAVGPSMALPMYLAWYEPERDWHRAVFFEPSKQFQWLTGSIAFWYTWTNHNLHLVYLAEAHKTGLGIMRFLGDEFCDWYLNMPVGYEIDPSSSLEYINNLHDMFTSD
jgi:hypothetical protein